MMVKIIVIEEIKEMKGFDSCFEFFFVLKIIFGVFKKYIDIR